MRVNSVLCCIHEWLSNSIILESALDSRTRMTMSTRFSHRTTEIVYKPASFLQEKDDTIVILVQGSAKMLSCQNKSRTQ